MPDDYTTNTLNQGLATEAAPSLSDIASPEEGAGAWPKGWYRAEIIQGYQTGKGTVFETSDVMAQSAASRNLFVCFAIHGDVYVPSSHDPSQRKLTKGPGGVRNIRYTLNYRPANNSPETIARVKAAYGQFGNVNKMPKELQSVALSLGRIGQLEKATFKLPFEGRFATGPLIGQKLDVRLDIGEKSFNEVEAVAPAGAHVK